MTVPLLLLAALSIITGYLGIPEFIRPVLPGPEGMGAPHEGLAAAGLMLLATLLGLGGIATAYVFYVKSPELPDRLIQRWREAYALSFNKWYVDEFYDRTIVQPTVALANGLWKYVEVEVIDAMVNGVGAATVVWGLALRLVQSGEVQHYALAMALGAVAILGLYLMLLL